MPYEGQFANKTAHSGFFKNPDIQAFLKACDYLTAPTDKEAESLQNLFVEPPVSSDARLPDFVVAVDGSNYEASLDDKLPSTKVGYIKIGAVLIDLSKLRALKVGQFVDPFKVAALQDDNTSLTFSVPSANIRWGKKKNVRDSFRALVDNHLFGISTRFDANDYTTSLRSTLFALASLRPGEMHTGDVKKLKIANCPDCGNGPITVKDIPDQQHCNFCGAEVYPADCLRIWEDVADYQSNQIAINRLMLALEHLIPMHYVRHLYKNAPLLLSGVAFFIDGPLALFGGPSWMQRSILQFLDEVNRKLAKFNQLPLIVLGLQKTGQVVDHVRLIDRFIPANRLMAIDDEYRYKYILAAREPSQSGFGRETYYGQDFIFKTPSGRAFVFGLSYPFASKELHNRDFNQEKTRLENYLQLPTALKLITHLESDLYENAVVPIALAHRFTAISLKPGGRVLDLLTRNSLKP